MISQGLLAILLVSAIFAAPANAGNDTAETDAVKPADVTVYKTPWCGCCTGWVDHMTAHGYAVTTHDMSELDAVKSMTGVPPALQSCHTAVVDGYTIEGHVPAAAIDKLLAERPDIKGLAVPGMPIGSPGMEGDGAERYQVMSFDEAGTPSVFMDVEPSQ